jgi:hypothetical protein
MQKLNSSYDEPKNNSIVIFEDVDVDRYMSSVENELKKFDCSLDKRAFIENIVNILDKLIQPKKFNKTIFFHILNFANLNTDSPILFLDFFRSFFTVYESMKKNREMFAEQVLQINSEIEKAKADYIKFKSDEVVLENGLTNLSTLEIIQIDNKTKQNDKNKLGVNFTNKGKVIFKYGNFSQTFFMNNNKIIEYKVTNPSERNVKIFLVQDDRENYIDSVNINDCMNNRIKYNFTQDKEYYEFEFLWMESKVTYTNKRILELEEKAEENKHNITLLTNCINHIDGKWDYFLYKVFFKIIF